MDATVGIGGSVNIRQLGLAKALEERGISYFIAGIKKWSMMKMETHLIISIAVWI
jgi:hypothetical protein